MQKMAQTAREKVVLALIAFLGCGVHFIGIVF